MPKKLTKTQIEKLATEIRDLLLNRDMWVDTRIYFNGKAYSTDDGEGHYYYKDPNHLVVLENMDPHRYTEYAGDILTMTFEGPLYEALNYSADYKFEKEFLDLFNKYGLFYELGEAWNLTAVEM